MAARRGLTATASGIFNKEQLYVDLVPPCVTQGIDKADVNGPQQSR